MDIVLLIVLFIIAAFAQIGVVFFLVWMLKARQAWPLIVMAIKGHGSILLKTYFDRSVSVHFSTKPMGTVDWKIKDKVTGQVKKVTIPLRKVYHTLRGTGICVHFCPITASSNIDLNAKEQEELNKEIHGALLAGEYLQGYNDASNYKTIGGMDIEKIQLILLVVLIIILCVNAWFTYNVLGVVGAIKGG